MNDIFKKIIKENKKLETQRLNIFPFVSKVRYLKDLFEIYSNKENTQYYTLSYETFSEFEKDINDKIKLHTDTYFGFISYMIQDKSDGKIIGIRNIILDYRFDMQMNKYAHYENIITEIIIHKDMWGKGYGYEATIEIFKYLQLNGIKNIISFINRDNHKALSFDNKMGFKQSNIIDAIDIAGYFPSFTVHSGSSDTIHYLNTDTLNFNKNETIKTVKKNWFQRIFN